MADELTLSLSATAVKDGVSFDETFNDTFDVAGGLGLKNVQWVTTDALLTVGDITTPGYLVARNLALAPAFTEGSATPDVTPHGTSGSTTWGYKIVACQTDPHGEAVVAASTEGTTSTGNATLNGTNYNIITWLATAGADFYRIYRTTAGGTPSSTGLIADNVTDLTYNDEGGAGDATTAPSVSSDNVILLGEDGSSYPNKLKGREFMLVRWNGDIHAKASTTGCDLEYILVPD
jgi:hypothetical protein